ncbi:hypothetical protein B0H34DRAFT_679470 [Crassisporium funariophilum]|nr:hypothetical protein B0H34DRAFT_679470 [Crassisporium funariophilum]
MALVPLVSIKAVAAPIAPEQETNIVMRRIISEALIFDLWNGPRNNTVMSITGEAANDVLGCRYGSGTADRTLDNLERAECGDHVDRRAKLRKFEIVNIPL